MQFLKKYWWKALSLILLFYTIIGGLLLPVPRLDILNETIRNLYFHVPMWFGMSILYLASMVYAIRYLSTGNSSDDIHSNNLAQIGTGMGLMGIVTGMIWAKFTWGEAWSNDPKQNVAAIALLIYFAYFVLRGSLEDPQQKGRISAIYNVFAFAVVIPLIYIIPRMTDSLHPGNGGNPGFNAYDLDSKLRLIFYPAVIGWILLGVWISSLKSRMDKLRLRLED